jgi:hypothetical protein
MKSSAAVLAFSTALLVTSACSAASPSYPNTPEGIVRSLFDSLEQNDADQYLDSILPEDRKQPGYFFYRQLVQAIFSGFGMGQVEAAKLRISFSGLNLAVLDNNGAVAHVQASGHVRDLNLAIEQDFATILTVVNFDGTWLVSVTGAVPLSLTFSPLQPGPGQAGGPTPDPCGGWRFRLASVDLFESDGWLYMTGNIALENANAPVMSDFGSRDLQSLFRGLTMTTSEGFTYPIDNWSFIGTANYWVPPGYRFLSVGTFTSQLVVRPAAQTHGHVVVAPCGTLDLDNPEHNLAYPSDQPPTPLLGIGDSIVLPEGRLTVTSVETGDKTSCGGFLNATCVHASFTNSNSGYEARPRIYAVVIGSDGILHHPGERASSFTFLAGPGQTVDRMADFGTSSTGGRVLIISNYVDYWVYQID